MTVEILGRADRRHVGKGLAVTGCQGCGMHRLCRQTSTGLWLCVGGPCKCYRHQNRVELDKQRASAQTGGRE